jgi:hypothetical protein
MESPDRLAQGDKGEPRETASNLPAKPAKQAARKPAKSGPNFFRKALRPIWPLSKHDKPTSGNHATPRDLADR